MVIKFFNLCLFMTCAPPPLFCSFLKRVAAARPDICLWPDILRQDTEETTVTQRLYSEAKQNTTNHNLQALNRTLQIISPPTQTEGCSNSTLYIPKQSPEPRTHSTNLHSLQRSKCPKPGSSKRAWVKNWVTYEDLVLIARFKKATYLPV